MLVVLGSAVATWQLTLGFTHGIPFAYLLGILGLVALVRWLRTGRPSLRRSVVVATVAGAALFAGTAALQVQPYLDVSREFGARFSEIEVAALSPLPQSFVVAPRGSAVWGDLTEPLRGTIRTDEQAIFIGACALLLALLGLSSGAFERRIRAAIVVGVVVSAALSLGTHVAVGALRYLFPYRLLHEVAPGWDALRTPGRLVVFTTLGVALLAGAGADRLARTVRARLPGDLASAMTAVLLAVVAIEGASTFDYPGVPPVPREQLDAPAPQLHLPMVDRDALYLMWSTEGYPDLVNGLSVFRVPAAERLRAATATFPDAATIELLRRVGVRSVIVHRTLAIGTPLERSTERRELDPSITRVAGRDAVVYRLAPLDTAR
jgi:hypothetical protein